MLVGTDPAKRREMKATSVRAGLVDAAGAGFSGSQPTCVVEMADARGAKMRVDLRGDSSTAWPACRRCATHSGCAR